MNRVGFVVGSGLRSTQRRQLDWFPSSICHTVSPGGEWILAVETTPVLQVTAHSSGTERNTCDTTEGGRASTNSVAPSSDRPVIDQSQLSSERPGSAMSTRRPIESEPQS